MRDLERDVPGRAAAQVPLGVETVEELLGGAHVVAVLANEDELVAAVQLERDLHLVCGPADEQRPVPVGAYGVVGVRGEYVAERSWLVREVRVAAVGYGVRVVGG